MTKESKKYLIYDKTIKQWYEIPEDLYRVRPMAHRSSQEDAVSRRMFLPT